DVADRADVDLVDLRRMQRERPLDADAERVLADRERLARARALALDHDPLEHLDPLPVPLDHAEVDANGVPRFEPRHVAQLTALEILDGRAHVERRPGAARNGSGTAAATRDAARASANRDPVRGPVRREHLPDQVRARHAPPLARVARRAAVVA